jgi:serine/threonine protein phosphatase 1
MMKRFVQQVILGRAPDPKGPPRCRAYAIGDVHGRLDLLEDVLTKIEEDIEHRPKLKTFIVFLGDLIDRGPASAGVIERLRTYLPTGSRPVFLAGNHEEILLRVLSGDADVMRQWLKFGGAECAESYGLDPQLLNALEDQAAIESLRAKIPRKHREFLESFGDTFRFGDYLFVHAGIRPGVDIESQEAHDLRWIREPFLGHSREHGFVVVHGHTIVKEVEERPNRIGIDTGAYRSGVLTALVVEEAQRWYITS